MCKNSHYRITILPKTVEKKLIAVETVDFTENGRSTAKTVVVGRSGEIEQNKIDKLFMAIELLDFKCYPIWSLHVLFSHISKSS